MAAETPINPETLNLIIEATKAGPESQLRDVDAMDAKAVQIFATASVIVGLAAFAGTAGGSVSTGLFILGFIAYAVAASGAFSSLRVRDYLRPFPADSALDSFWDAEPFEVQHALADSISKAYKGNQALLKEKASRTQVAIISTGLESLFVGAALIAARL